MNSLLHPKETRHPKQLKKKKKLKEMPKQTDDLIIILFIEFVIDFVWDDVLFKYTEHNLI